MYAHLSTVRAVGSPCLSASLSTGTTFLSIICVIIVAQNTASLLKIHQLRSFLSFDSFSPPLFARMYRHDHRTQPTRYYFLFIRGKAITPQQPSSMSSDFSYWTYGGEFIASSLPHFLSGVKSTNVPLRFHPISVHKYSHRSLNIFVPKFFCDGIAAAAVSQALYTLLSLADKLPRI